MEPTGDPATPDAAPLDATPLDAATPKAVMAYCDALTYRQGDTLQVRAAGRGRVDIDLVRLNHPPDDPNWPVPLVTPVAGVQPVTVVLEPQVVHAGSYLVIDDVEALASATALTGSLYVLPTLLDAGHPQTLLSTLDDTGTSGFAIVVEDGGQVVLRWGRSSGEAGRLVSPQPLVERYWHVVSVSLDQDTGMVALSHHPIRPVPHGLGTWTGNDTDESVQVAGATTVMVGAGKLSGRPVADRLPGRPSVSSSFNGKVERPALFAGAVESGDLAALAPETGPASAADVLGGWDLSQFGTGTQVTDISGHGHDGIMVNTPAPAVTGRWWKGRAADWTTAPDEYAAVYLHDDDLDDTRWPVVATVAIPADLPSAVYAVRLREQEDQQGVEDLVPVVVGPSPEHTGQADVVVVMSTFTYMAYANLLGTGEKIDYVAAGLVAPGDPIIYEEHQRLEEYPEIGGSVYDVHSDGSGRMYSSPRRPLLNCRPNWKSSRRDAYRHLAADLYILGWLDKLGIPYEVISDHDVHAQGVDLLSNYSAALTGTHPEYISEQIFDACEAFLELGGSLLYLGGNGFYWVTTESPTVPELVEIRRGYNGTRTWTSAPGECHHSMTGEIGGLWRYRGRGPNALVGVGMAAQGADGGAAPYRRTEHSHEGSASFLFEGVTAEIIGETGYDMGAAAGDEVDRFDVTYGSAPWGIVVASSTELSEYYKLAIEEIQITRENTGGDNEKGVRADLTLIEQEAGGFVFSTGSISWVQSMAVDFYDTDTARVTENALRRALRQRRQASK